MSEIWGENRYKDLDCATLWSNKIVHIDSKL